MEGGRGKGSNGKGGGRRGTQAELDFPRTRSNSSVDPTFASDTQTGGATHATNSSAGLPPATPAQQMPGYRLPLPPAHVQPPADDRDQEMADGVQNEGGESTAAAAAPKAKKGRGMNKTKVGTTDKANRVELRLSSALDFVVVNPTKDIADHSDVVSEISELVRNRNKGEWLDYGSQCQEQKNGGEGDVCWDFFKRKFRWNMDISPMVETLFRQIATRRLSDHFSYAKRMKKRPDWIGEKRWAELLEYWANNEGFKKRSKAAKENRAKGPYLTHGHGSQTAKKFKEKFTEKFVKEHGREPDAVTTLAAAKSRKGQLIEGWQEPVRQLEQNHRTGLGDDRAKWPDVPTPEYWLQPKKGRVSGQGRAPAQLFGFPRPRRATTGIHIHVQPSVEERREQARKDVRLNLLFEEMAANNPGLQRRAETEYARIDAELDGRGVGTSSTVNPEGVGPGRRVDDLYPTVDRAVDDDDDIDLSNPEDYLNDDDGGVEIPHLGGDV